MNFEWMRTEVYHPLSVHIPIGLLLLATVAVAFQFFSRNKSGWQRLVDITLYAGTAFIWLSVYTGDLADGIVSRALCDPTVLKDHENFAFYTAYVYSGAAVINLLLRFVKSKLRTLSVLLFMATITGAGLMTYVGHLGASLVYEQAAGVTVPTEDCEGF